ncbi:MAG: type II toxin-antitoxin system RelE/ParE family toxin [Dehalococcoidia bacterium]|nr:type II toxin-antitoxin system RelE/ParE family toxin [Dehalococcoidia bacterium]
MKYRLTLSRDAASYFQRLDSSTQRRMREAMRALTDNPRHEWTKPLKGHQGRALRVGGWRILYGIDDDARTVHVHRIAPRGQVYRDL